MSDVATGESDTPPDTDFSGSERPPTEDALFPDAAVNEKAWGASDDLRQPSPEERAYDRHLVERVQAGDMLAFRELFERHHRRAYAVALGVVKNQSDAADIVQDAFVKVHRHVENFQGASSFYTWLYRIVMNLAIDHIRKQQHRRTVEFDERVAPSDELSIGPGAIVSGLFAGSPRNAVLRRELSETIQAALETLPEHHRMVLLLREVEGMSYEEMATVLEIPKGTIMSRLFHARRKMQEALASYVGKDLDSVE